MDIRAKVAFGAGIGLFLAFWGAVIGGVIALVIFVPLFILASGSAAGVAPSGWLTLFHQLLPWWWVPSAICAGIAVALGILLAEFGRALDVEHMIGRLEKD